jgi:hypothetical protein
MKPDLLRRIYWQLLLLVSSNRYEKSRATHAGISFPTGFDATQSIFIHIPKTGGVSIAAALYGVLIPHYTWQEWRRVNPTKFKRYFKFAVLRDPVTRFASSFDFVKAGGINATDQEFSRVELADFVLPMTLPRLSPTLELHRASSRNPILRRRQNSSSVVPVD